MYLWAVSALQGHVLYLTEFFFNFFLTQLKNTLVLSHFRGVLGICSCVSAGRALVFKCLTLRPIFLFSQDC